MAYQATALKARQIVNNTFRTDKRNAEYVRPARLETLPWGYRITTITKKPKEQIRRYQVSIKFPKGYVGRLSRCNEIQVDCTCSRYIFVWNYALNKAGAAIKDRTNGEAPDVTNPQLKSGICKHGWIALTTMLKADPHWPSSQIKQTDPAARKKKISLTTIKL